MRHAAPLHGTTILAVRQGGRIALAGDGQVTLGQTVVKHHAKKIQRLHNGQVLAGFAGSTADAMALIHRFEARLEEYRGNLQRAAVELAQGMIEDVEALLNSPFLLFGTTDERTDQVARLRDVLGVTYVTTFEPGAEALAAAVAPLR